MTIQVKIDTREFTPVVKEWLKKRVPEMAVKGINEISKEFRRELVKATPRVASPPSAKRRGLRIIKGTLYGPLRKAWRRRGIKKLGQVASVVNVAFYAHMVEFGTTRSRARSFVAPVLARAGGIMERALKRVTG